MDKSYIALRLDVGLNESATHFEPLYHEYVHHLLRRLTPQLPVWMVEGLAELYGNTRIENDRVLIGTPNARNLGLLRENLLLPLPTLFGVDARSPYYNEQNKMSIFYAESWALTHYLMARDWRENTDRVNQFITLLGQNIPPLDAAPRSIGNLSTLESALRDYVQNFAFTALRIERPRLEQQQSVSQTLSEAESLAVRGDLLSREGEYAKATEMLEKSIKLDPKLGGAYENLARLSIARNRLADAEKWSTQALALAPTSYLANYYYAMAVAGWRSKDEETLGRAETSLRASIAKNPEFAPAYDEMALILSLPGPRQNLDEAHKMATIAIEKDPADLKHTIRLVEVLDRMDREDDAIEMAKSAVSQARTPAEVSEASAALAGAQQFKISRQKMNALREEQASNATGQSKETEARQSKDKASGQSGVQILSDTTGVDFAPYITPLLQTIRGKWYNLVPPVAMPPMMKKGRCAIEFAIGKDGTVSGMKIALSSRDVAMDRAAWGSITASIPFAPLPSEFKGQHLALRFYFSYNPSPADIEFSKVAGDIQRKVNKNLSNDKNAIADLETQVGAISSLLEKGELGEDDVTVGRYYRGMALSAINGLRRRRGMEVDRSEAESALRDFDEVISRDRDLGFYGATKSNAQYNAGIVAWFQLEQSDKAYAYWNACAEKDHEGCQIDVADGHLTGEGREKVDYAQAIAIYQKLVEAGKGNSCLPVQAARRLAQVKYFLGASGDQEDVLAWMQRSYDFSAKVQGSAAKSPCRTYETQIEEFLYCLERGERRNELLERAGSQLDEDRLATKAAIGYLSGVLDSEKFEEGLRTALSEGDRCFALFNAQWYAKINRKELLEQKYRDQLSAVDKFQCLPTLIFAKKFQSK